MRLRAAVNQSLAQRKEAEMKVIIPALALLQIAAGRNTQGVAGGQGVKDCFNIMQNFPSRSDVPDTLYLHCLLLVEIRNPRIDIEVTPKS